MKEEVKDITIMITGDHGTGKTRLAERIEKMLKASPFHGDAEEVSCWSLADSEVQHEFTFKIKKEKVR